MSAMRVVARVLLGCLVGLFAAASCAVLDTDGASAPDGAAFGAPEGAGHGARSDSALALSDPAHGLSASFAADGVRVALGARRAAGGADGEPARAPLVSLRTVALGRDTVREPLGWARAVSAAGSRVVLSHGAALAEWWQSAPLGLEQGFEVAAPPGGEGPVVIGIAVAGLAPELAADGTKVWLRAPNGEVRLTGSDAFAEDGAGRALPIAFAVSGTTVELRIDDRGAQYPLSIDPVWSEEQKLVLGNPAAGDTFGEGVALDGDTAIVGAWQKAGVGRAYVFVRSGTTWALQQELIPSDGTTGASFGFSVALDGDTAVISAGTSNVAGIGNTAGAAYVFVRNGQTWSESQKLVASDAAAGMLFGSSVSISGDVIVVGAMNATVNGHASAGAAYTFVRSGGTFSEEHKIIATDAAATDHFGADVAISGDTAVIAAVDADLPGLVDAGAVYVLVHAGNTWTEQQKLANNSAAANDHWGYSVALSGDYAIVGFPYAMVTGNPPWLNVGAADIFERSGTVWSRVLRTTGTSAAADTYFGIQVAIDGDRAFVGASFADVSGNANAGAAHVYARDPSNGWSEVHRYVASDVAANARFGHVVAVSGRTFLAGAPQATVGGAANAGAAYILIEELALGDSCTTTSECQAPNECVDGVCCASSACAECEACNVAGFEGTCSALAVGASCDDGHACTLAASCDAASVCVASSSVACVPSDACHVAGVCQEPSGACTTALAPEGTACTVAGGDGTCSAGSCVATDGGGSCGCELVGPGAQGRALRSGVAVLWLAGLVGLGLVRRGRRRGARDAMT